ncbi:hypothetical protein AAMO2058_000892200 [Amorphochlora amoebiformis]
MKKNGFHKRKMGEAGWNWEKEVNTMSTEPQNSSLSLVNHFSPVNTFLPPPNLMIELILILKVLDK